MSAYIVEETGGLNGSPQQIDWIRSYVAFVPVQLQYPYNRVRTLVDLEPNTTNRAATGQAF